MNSENRNTIYTIGHSNKPFSETLKILKNYKISLLVDVRSYPYSKYVPQFDRERLSSALTNSDIIYWYAGDNLGGRPKDPSCYRCGKIPEGKANYLELVDYREMAKRSWFKEEITKIVVQNMVLIFMSAP